MKLDASTAELIRHVEEKHLKKKIPSFSPGDTLRVTLRVPEGDKERTQVFEGVVISRRGGGSREMVTVRRISFGVGVERVFPLHSPFMKKIEVVRGGRARRAKLFYLRDKSGKDARLKAEQLQPGEQASPAEAAGATPAPEAEESAAPPKAADAPAETSKKKAKKAKPEK